MTNLSANHQKIIVIGSGPVGVRFVDEYLKAQTSSSVTLFGDEKYRPYNRVQLSSLLAGEVSQDDIALALPNNSELFNYVPRRIVEINAQLQHVKDQDGQLYNYDSLVLAMGASPHVPNISGVDQTGVYTFRSLKDAQYLSTRTLRATHIVIVGGGLLGIETAKALHRNNTKITLVQQGTHLMNRQLDEPAAQILQEELEQQGIQVITNSGVRTVNGAGRVTGVVLRKREKIDCDTVLFCSGISPNIDLARNARIRVGRGIQVNESLQTSNENIYAIGECSEFEGITFGIVNPGFEQAAILANVLTGGEAAYSGSLLSSQLKVVDRQVRSFGEVTNYQRTPYHKELVYRANDKYRKLVVYQGKLVGGIGVGEWDEAARLQEAFQQGRKLTFWQRITFSVSGQVWPFTGAGDVSQWNPNSIVCQCQRVIKQEISVAIKNGATCIEPLKQCTKAGTVCGSCVPLLEQMLQQTTGNKEPRQKEWGWGVILLASVLVSILTLLVLFVPGLQVGESVQEPAVLQEVWNDKFWKQVTGFSLLGLSAVGLLMSLRKRIKNERLIRLLGQFSYWRLFHIVLGSMCAIVLLAHTGLHTGDNLNQVLLFNFLAVLIMGSFASAVLAISHRLQPIKSQNLRKFWSWAHIIVTWPLPILLATHVFTVYYF